MLDNIFEKAWCCLNRIAPTTIYSEKKPPDKFSTITMPPSNFKTKLNATLATGPPTNFRPLKLNCKEMAASFDNQYLETAFRELLVGYFFFEKFYLEVILEFNFLLNRWLNILSILKPILKCESKN